MPSFVDWNAGGAFVSKFAAKGGPGGNGFTKWNDTREYTMITQAQTSTNHRLCRDGLIDMQSVAATPQVIMDLDWDRVIARKTARDGTIFA